MNNMRIKLFYIFIIFSIAFTSCRSTKKETKRATKQLAVDSVYAKMKENQFHTKWFTGKFKAVYQMPDKKQAFSGLIRLRTDSVFWVSIYAVMNIEIFRLEITPDSFRFVNRLSKTYMSESMSYFKERFNVDVDLEMLQSLMLGNDFPYYETDVFKLFDHKNSYQLSTISRKKLKKHSKNGENKLKALMQNMWIDKTNYRILKQSVKVIGEDKAKLRVVYSDFEKVDSMLIAKHRLLKFREDQNTFLEISFNKFSINSPLKFPFRIPKKYTEYIVPNSKTNK
ncbi:MAG: hypothetical protein DRI86_10560 [Bacteroidetes bacterium]|nr:MAG: hypothetical protein DRI86_10560 [Bacteroidota bacterium]